MKLKAAYDLTHGGKFVLAGDEFEVCDSDGAGLMAEGFQKPTTTNKATKPATGGGSN